MSGLLYFGTNNFMRRPLYVAAAEGCVRLRSSRKIGICIFSGGSRPPNCDCCAIERSLRQLLQGIGA
jgi:hypothetical protein